MKKGANVYHRSDGRWEARLLVGYSSNGIPHYKSFYGHSYKEAYNKKMNYKIDDEPTFLKKQELTSLTFLEVSDLWLTDNQPYWKPSTYAKYQNVLDSYILPIWSNKLISSLQQSDYDMLREQLEESLSQSTLDTITTVVRSIFKFAVSKHFLCSLSFIFPKSTRKKILFTEVNLTYEEMLSDQYDEAIRILSKEEMAQITEYLVCHSSPSHIGILIALYEGMRIGELCALRWKDLDFVRKTIYILRTYHRISQPETVAGKPKTVLRFDLPKNGKTRLIPMQPQLAEYLWEMSQSYSPDDYILSGNSQPMEPRSCSNHFKRLLKACNLPDINFHALRHTFASNCVEAGIDIKVLSEILGHSSVKITMDLYVHLSMQYKQQQLSILQIQNNLF